MNSIKNLKIVFYLFFIFSISSLSAQNLGFESVERADGTAFFSIDKTTGQISYMLDYGSTAGVWKNYGGKITRSSQEKNLSFYAIDRTEGSAFFSMDGATGQVYFMLDYGTEAGVWKNYGGVVPATGAHLSFQASTRPKGTAFFAMNNSTGQVYFMLDFGSDAGNWKNYGGTIAK